MDGQDVQWEDLPEENEEVQTVSGEGLSDEDLVLGAEDADKGRQAASGKVRKAITRATREHAATVHRSCALCLVGRALLYDKALQDEELQATLISHLEPSTSSLLDPEHETQRAINCLLPFLKWFRQHFQIVPAPASQEGNLDDFPFDAPGIHAQVLRAAQNKLGSEEAVVALFVQLARSHGVAARFVRLLDGAPLSPWQKKTKTLRTQASVSRGASQPKQKGKGGSGKGGDGSSKAGLGGKGKQAQKDLLEDHKPSKGNSKAGTKKQQQGGAGPSNKEGEQAGGGKCGGGKKRGASSGAEETADAAAEKRQRRGDDEFERQLQMAMIATQAEQAARQKLGPREQSPAAEREGRGGSGGAGTSKAALTPSSSVLHSAAQTPAGKKGGVVVAAPDFASCWAEVWCGSPEYGRWVHVDVVATEVDRPQKVEPCAAASGTYAAAAGYVVACEEGVVRDVTTRYLTNTLAVKRLRDGPWWAATQQKLEQLAEMQAQARNAPGPPEPTATIDLTSDKDMQEETVKGDSTQQQGQDGPGQNQGEVHHHHQQQQQQHAPEQRACRQASSGGAGPSYAAPASANKSAHSAPASKQQDASTSHINGQKGSVPAGSPHQNQNGVAVSASGKASSSVSHQDPGSRAPGASAKSGGRKGEGGQAGAASAAALRAKREEAELQHQEKAGLGLPTSIEGFKAHPLYVLQRHITKYEALKPNTLPVGLHKGEPYYPRQDLSELHTTDRWRREGWKVLDSELSRPAKLVNKRAQPAPRGAQGRGVGVRWDGSGGSRGRGRGGGGTGKGTAENGTRDLYGNVVCDWAEDEQLQQQDGEGGGGGDGSDASSVKLYGKWQVEPHVAAAKDGKVPRNERGSIEVPPFVASMPLGCVHLPITGLGPICRSLDVDFAPALTGFELQSGRSVPRFEGIVVCEAEGQRVMSVYLEREGAKQEAAHKQRMRAAHTAWIQLLQALRTRMQLADSYQQPDEVGTSNAPKPGQQAAHAARMATDSLTSGANVPSVSPVQLAHQQQQNQQPQQQHQKGAQQQQQQQQQRQDVPAPVSEPQPGLETEEI